MTFFSRSFVSVTSVIIKVIKNSKWTFLEIILLIILATTSIFLVSFNIWKRISYKSYYYPHKAIKTNYLLECKTIKYKRTANDELIFSKEFEIKSLINNLESIFDRYIWTGKIKVANPTPKKNIHSIEKADTFGIWNYIRIILYKTLNKGESETFVYKMPKISNCSSSSPFVSTDTDIPTKKVVLNVDLGDQYANAELFLEEFRSIDSDFPLFSEKTQFTKHGEYKWDIDNPKRYRYYRIRWS